MYAEPSESQRNFPGASQAPSDTPRPWRSLPTAAAKKKKLVQDGCMLSGNLWKQFLYKSSIDKIGTLHMSPVCEQTFQQNCSKSMKFKRLSCSRVFNKQNPRSNVALMYSGVIWFFPIWRQCFCLEEWESVKLPAQESLEPKWLRYFFH